MRKVVQDIFFYKVVYAGHNLVQTASKFMFMRRKTVSTFDDFDFRTRWPSRTTAVYFTKFVQTIADESK